ncbi:sensor histidine kinase [Limosilactobacillus caecicola]|uniref:sensor histidine kinase n=1 Tax=Limosilactobacillus caecicola TaxID=2941332 RepID=UPI00203D1C25|nr:HAMP domain-containing sensor histidine kinase [Limosilactobacillus caecicola]
MIRHFQKRFILVSTLALIVVLVTIIGSISAIAYWRSSNEVNSVLSYLVQNDGQMQGRPPQRQQPILASHFSKEGMFQYRYFSAKINQQTKSTQIDDQHILSVSPAAIQRLAKRVIKSGTSSGAITYHGTRYAYRVKKSGQTQLVVFLDESLLMNETSEILRFSILLGIVSCILYTTLLVLFSKRAIRPIIENERRQREFITNAGHELKTPLTVIAANTEMQELTDGESEWTKSNKAQVERLTLLINNLIALARSSERRSDEAVIDVDASGIAKRVAESFKGVAMHDHKKMLVNIQKGLKFRGIESRYTELLNILLDNATKYCDPDGTIIFTLQKNRRSRNLNLTVANSYAAGKDIDYTKFFDRFYRGDTAHKIKKQSGFGIGLSMAQQIVEQSHGKIKAEYKNGMIGFHITLR